MVMTAVRLNQDGPGGTTKGQEGSGEVRKPKEIKNMSGMKEVVTNRVAF
jgi:hypothetical protein